jgi:hypothetical protein
LFQFRAQFFIYAPNTFCFNLLHFSRQKPRLPSYIFEIFSLHAYKQNDVHNYATIEGNHTEK